MPGLTLNDCRDILNKINLPGDEIIDYKLKPISEKTRGYLGEHLTLSINSKNETSDFFVKSIKSANELNACFDSFFEKEVFAYQFFNSAKEKCKDIDLSFLPSYYHHTEDGSLVLENLEKDGFYGCDEVKLGEDKVILVLEKLAKMHAACFKFADWKKKELKRSYDLSEEYVYGPLFTRDNASCFKYISAGVRGAAHLVNLAKRDEGAKKLIFEYKEKFLDLLVDDNNFSKVFCHGDLWSYNVLFKNDGNNKPIDCKIIDYQLITYAPPALDVTMVIYHIGDHKVHKSTNKFYEIYYNFLREELSKLELDINIILSYEEFQKSCKLFMPWSKFICLIYKQSSLAEDQVWRDLSKNPEKSRKIIMGNLREQFVEENFVTNRDYRKILTRILDDNILTLKNPLINIEDLYQVVGAVRGNTNFEIVDIHLKELSERGGYLGEHFTLDVSITSDSNCKSNISICNFFIKFTPFLQATRDFCDQTGACYKEINFFNRLVPLFKQFNLLTIEEVTAKVYLATEEYIIFENLQLKNYKIQNPRFSITYNKMKAGLSSLAKLHATAIILEQKCLKGTLINNFPLEFKEAFYNQSELSKNLIKAHSTGTNFLIKIFSNNSSPSLISNEEFCKISENIFLDFPNLVKPSSKFTNTICHGDLWGNNLMFKEDNHCVIIDFQSYRYRPPAHDLMQMIYLTTGIEDREKHLQDYLQIYYNQFRKLFEDNGLDVNDYLTHNEFLESCKEEELFAVAQTFTHFQTILLSKENKELVFSSSESCNGFFFGDLRRHFLKIAVGNDEQHRLKLQEAMRDFRRICEKNKSRYLL